MECKNVKKKVIRNQYTSPATEWVSPTYCRSNRKFKKSKKINFEKNYKSSQFYSCINVEIGKYNQLNFFSKCKSQYKAPIQSEKLIR